MFHLIGGGWLCCGAGGGPGASLRTTARAGPLKLVKSFQQPPFIFLDLPPHNPNESNLSLPITHNKKIKLNKEFHINVRKPSNL